MGAANVVITLKTGCYALLAAGEAEARMYRAWIPRIEAVSTVGSGDAFLAGFLSAHQAGQAADQCLKMGLACGAANTQTVGAGRVRVARGAAVRGHGRGAGDRTHRRPRVLTRAGREALTGAVGRLQRTLNFRHHRCDSSPGPQGPRVF